MPRPKKYPSPPCAKCGSSKVSPNQTLKSGSIQYRCRECGYAWTPDRKPTPKIGGSKPKYLDRPLTNAEYQRVYRRRNPEKVAENQRLRRLRKKQQNSESED